MRVGCAGCCSMSLFGPPKNFVLIAETTIGANRFRISYLYGLLYSVSLLLFFTFLILIFLTESKR